MTSSASPSVRRAAALGAATILAGAGVLASTGCIAIIGYDSSPGPWSYAGEELVETERHSTHALREGPMMLDAEAHNGSIWVRVDDVEQVEIHATLRTIDEERAQGVQIHFVEREDSDWVDLRAEWPGGKPKRGEGVSFEIVTPRADGARLVSHNGKLGLHDATGHAHLETSNGSITIEHHAGDVHAESSNGKIDLVDIEGDVHAQTSNGRVSVRAVTGAVEALTSNGSVTVELETSAAGPVTIETSNGSATLEIGPGFGGTIDYRTSNASASVDRALRGYHDEHSRTSGVVRLPGSGPRSSVHTSNGSVRIKYAE